MCCDHTNVIPVWVGRNVDKVTRDRFKAIDLHLPRPPAAGALRWLEQGYTLPTIGQRLGHSNMDSLKVYLGTEQGTVRVAVKRQYSRGKAVSSLTPPDRCREARWLADIHLQTARARSSVG